MKQKKKKKKKKNIFLSERYKTAKLRKKIVSPFKR